MQQLSNPRRTSASSWLCLFALVAPAALAEATMPRPQLDPWGNPLPTGRWPAPWVERTTESLGPVIVVDTTVDVVAIDGSCSLREAIDNANAGADTSGGDCTVATTITFDPATDGIPIVLGGAADEDNNASGDLDIAVGLTLLGNGRDLTILDGDQNDRVLHVLSSADTFALEGIEVRNGRPPAERGGGLLVGAHSALRDCRLRDNEALEVGGGVARRRWVWVGPPWCPRGPSSGSTPTRSSSVAPPSEQPVALGIQ